MKILAIDPGLMTGVSLIDWSDKDIPKKISTYEYNIEEFFLNIEKLITDSDVIVVENFLVTLSSVKKDFQPYSLHLIGIINYFVYHNKKKLIMQNPLDREFTPNQILKDLKLWHRGGAGHANQASRHAFYYMAMQHKPLAKMVLDLI